MENSHETIDENSVTFSCEPYDRSYESHTEENRDDTAQVESDNHSSVGELDSLRAEITRLQTQLEEKEREQAKAMQELEEFHRLFPHVPIRTIPQSVWNNRQNGIPLNAAYALYECEQARQFALAESVNRSNADRSAGQAGTHTAKEYFSADEVRAMTPQQVHEQYAVIRRSMQSW